MLPSLKHLVWQSSNLTRDDLYDLSFTQLESLDLSLNYSLYSLDNLNIPETLHELRLVGIPTLWPSVRSKYDWTHLELTCTVDNGHLIGSWISQCKGLQQLILHVESVPSNWFFLHGMGPWKCNIQFKRSSVTSPVYYKGPNGFGTSFVIQPWSNSEVIRWAWTS
jgi:hypothetical protein